MKPSEIILQDKYAQEDGAPAILRKISALVKSKDGILLQKNDTVMLIIRLGDSAVEIHVYTVDEPSKVVDSMRYFVKKLLDSDIEKAYFVQPRSGDNMAKMLKMFGLNLEKSDRPNYAYMITR